MTESRTAVDSDGQIDTLAEPRVGAAPSPVSRGTA